jgi:hypothetical protein
MSSNLATSVPDQVPEHGTSPCLMEWWLVLTSADEGITFVPNCVFWCRWHCAGRPDHDHTNAANGSELPTDVHHPQPGICCRWPKMLLHFRSALLDLRIGSQRKAHPIDYRLMVLLQWFGPLLQPLAGPKPLVENLEGPGVGSTPWYFGGVRRCSPGWGSKQLCC